jgi:hypothetical protein
MPEEMGEKTDVNQLSNYIAARPDAPRLQQDREPTCLELLHLQRRDLVLRGRPWPAPRPSSSWSASRAASRARLEHPGHLGKENRYGGFRAGQMHWLQRDGVAGFDRPTGIRLPRRLAENHRRHQRHPVQHLNRPTGVEWFYVAGETAYPPRC